MDELIKMIDGLLEFIEENKATKDVALRTVRIAHRLQTVLNIQFMKDEKFDKFLKGLLPSDKAPDVIAKKV